MSTERTQHQGWALSTLATDKGPVACIEFEGRSYNLSASLRRANYHHPVSSVADLFEHWDAASAALDKAADNLHADNIVTGHQRLAPFMPPGKIMCAGANYFRHLEEMGISGATKENQRLFFFTKSPRNAIVGEGDTVHMPLDTEAFDWEIELAAIIGRTARAVSVADALKHVAAYTVSVDFSARDLNRAPDTFYKLDWVAGKAQETCCPIGPRIVPASAFPDPQNIAMRLSVNDEIKQDDSTADMIFSVAEQISLASRIMTLHPGDLLLTGTPAGVGAVTQSFLNIGDKVTAEIDGIGSLTNTIQSPLLG